MTAFVYVGDSSYFFQGFSMILNSFYESRKICFSIEKFRMSDKTSYLTRIKSGVADVIVFDLFSINVVDCACIARNLSSETKRRIIIIGDDFNFHVFRAISGFCCAFIYRNASPENFEYLIQSNIQSKYSYSRVPRTMAVTIAELKVLNSILEHHHVGKVSQELNIDYKAVSFHKLKLIKKLDMSNWQFKRFIGEIWLYKKHEYFLL